MRPTPFAAHHGLLCLRGVISSGLATKTKPRPPRCPAGCLSGNYCCPKYSSQLAMCVVRSVNGISGRTPLFGHFNEGSTNSMVFLNLSLHTSMLPFSETTPRLPKPRYLTDGLTREAVSFIDRHATEPFFLYLAYNAPHSPYQAPQSYLDRVANISDPNRRTYAAMITAMDDGVGKVMQALSANNLTEKTLIFFLSDNGAPNQTFTRNAPLRGWKFDTLEGGIRVPFAIRWTGHLPAQVVYADPVSSLDIVATSVKAAGATLPADRPYDGLDLIPYLTGQQLIPQRTLFWRWFGLGASGPRGSVDTIYAARQGSLKLVRYQALGAGEPNSMT